jgi:hypothetical protein
MKLIVAARNMRNRKVVGDNWRVEGYYCKWGLG